MTFITDTVLRDKETLQSVNNYVHSLILRIESGQDSSKLDGRTKVYVVFDKLETISDWRYYMIDDSERTVFWLEKKYNVKWIADQIGGISTLAFLGSICDSVHFIQMLIDF